MKKKILILVVEDEKIIAHTLKERLTREGFDVLDVYDGEQGLKVAFNEHPDLILLDLLMPKMDGFTFLKEINKDPWGVNAKVIIITNVSKSDKIDEGINKNLGEKYDYLIKSNWSLEKIVSLIKKRLDIKN